MTPASSPEETSHQIMRLLIANQLQEAKKLCGTLQQSFPVSPHTFLSLANLARAENRLADAIDAYKKVLRSSPTALVVHARIAHCLLKQGDFENGWPLLYQYRKAALTPVTASTWIGNSSPAGKTILLHTEGGRGDEIQFIRYAPLVSALGATVLVQCYPELASLISRVNGVTATYCHGQPLPPHDFICPLMHGVPLAMRTTLASIPSQVPYLFATPLRSQAWASKLGPQKQFRIGLCWAGSENPAELRSRSISIFSSLAEIKSAEFHSLQVGPDSAQPRPANFNVIDHSASLTSYDETAALISNLDLIISVDTSIAHLAGAMGKRVFLLLPTMCDWRWLLDRTDSPWYPTMRLFRQKVAALDWQEVIVELVDEVRRMVRT